MPNPARPLTPPQAAAALRAAGTAIAAETTALAREALVWHPAPGEWCVLEILGHLIEAEQRGFAGRIRVLLERDRPRFETWDQYGVARARRDCERVPAALLAEFTRLRETSTALVDGLHATDLGRGGEHPTVGHLTIGDLLHEWVHHDRNHMKQMLANVQVFVWPHLGNAQRFSQP